LAEYNRFRVGYKSKMVPDGTLWRRFEFKNGAEGGNTYQLTTV